MILIVLSLSLLAGCFFRLPSSELRIDNIEGDIQCEFRIGNNAQFSKNKVTTDTVFDKEEFIELFNLRESYNPNYLKYHLDECSLKIDSREKPGEFEKIDRSEINIKILYDGMEKDRYSSVSVFEYNSKLYFFVLCMGSRSKDDEIGYYYMELPEDMQEYWRPILEKVREDDKKSKEKDYGSFTTERTYTYDKKYYAETSGSSLQTSAASATASTAKNGNSIKKPSCPITLSEGIPEDQILKSRTYNTDSTSFTVIMAA